MNNDILAIIKNIPLQLWKGFLFVVKFYPHIIFNLLYFYRANQWKMSLLNNLINAPINFWLIYKFDNEGNDAGRIAFFVLFILTCVGLLNDTLTWKRGLARSERWAKAGRRPTWFERSKNEYEQEDRYAFEETGKWYKWIAVGRYKKIKVEPKKRK